ncbi:unnamed protein product [Urochloa decumbens]|uniref:DUF4220 domain-containing protein n=1 Tax=Urochloa decumbens TaxID=240449 RepID=A0ABC9ARI8_9POAL
MAFWEDWDFACLMSRLIQWLWRFHLFFLRVFLISVVSSLSMLVVGMIAGQVCSTINTLFKRDEATRVAGVELFVVLATLMLVFRFVMDFFGPWYAYRSMGGLVTTVEMLNYSLVHYTIGLMQLSSAKVNDYFKVWAVLLVTLQYSVKVGRPYSRSKQIPLLDIMSSLWTSNLLRDKISFLLRIPLWLLWSLNAVRIISYFAASDKAKAINQESTRIVADYMGYEHELSDSSQLSLDAGDLGKEFTMERYTYVILGEHLALNDIQEEARLAPAVPVQAKQEQEERLQRSRRLIRLDPNKNMKLVTVDKIWDVGAGSGRDGLLGCTADRANRMKDVCLSFSLYKLLRRRFYNLPLHEVRLQGAREKIRRLVFSYILHDAERAFRVMAIELSFLQDLFYSKHAALFAAGFPATSLLLSLLLVAATAYMAYPVSFIPERMDQSDRNRITHGVFITRAIITIIIIKEVVEIYMYVFSQWTKVLIVCSFTKHRCMRHWLMEAVVRVLLCIRNRGTWNEKIRQHNLVISTRKLKLGNFFFVLRGEFLTGIKLEKCTKEAILDAFKRLDEEPDRLKLYFSNSFGAKDQPLHQKFQWAIDKLEADTHRILVWHIATCLCEIDLASDKAAVLRSAILSPRPFLRKPNCRPSPDATTAGDDSTAASWNWEDYTTAASLSNYCAYLVTQALVPDSSLVSRNVLGEIVFCEINPITWEGCIPFLLRRGYMQGVFARLMSLVNMPDQEHKHALAQGREPDVEAQKPKPKETLEDDIKNTLTCKGAKLAKQLIAEYGEDKAGLWKTLAVFWTGFLLYLAAYTKAAKHRAGIAGSRELTTHLWALLSHAGFLGNDTHGHENPEPNDQHNVDVDPPMEPINDPSLTDPSR